MKKIVLGMVVLAMFAVLVVPAAAQNVVYLVPQHISAEYCDSVPVEIWVDATNFQSGQINLTYDPTCANVTNWARNTTNFPMGTWTHKDDNDWVTFVGFTLKTGKYMIGTLTIHCVNESEDGCKTTLDFVEPSKLVDDFGKTVPATWNDGTFECSVEDTEPPYTSGHDPAPGATDVPIDTNIVVHILDDGSGVDKTTILMTVEGTPVTPVITGSSANYKLEYDPPANFSYGQVVDVTIAASDFAGNIMPTDSYSFTTEVITENKVFFVPQESKAAYCSEKDVEIWVDATNFQSGQINITYDPTCANVTNWARNTTNFPMGTWTHKDGSEWVTFVGFTLKTGKYMIGTLTIHCMNESEDGCKTTLDFVEPSKLFDDFGTMVSATWKDGTFECSVEDIEQPYTSGHDPAPGATNVPIDTNIVVHILDDGNGVDQTTIVMTVEGTSVVPTITGTTADYKLKYDSPTNFSYGQVVDVTIDASDLAGNVMPTDSYSFTTEVITENKVFFVPQHSFASGYCKTTDVEIWVNGTNFQSGQINLSYNSSCANVTNWERNTSNFMMGGWDSSVDGREWITFLRLSPLTGEYLIGTLTIHCVYEEDECTTLFESGDPSALFDPVGDEIPVNWVDGTFECKKGMCGDVAPYPDCNEEVNMGDLTRLLNNVTNSGMYPLCNAWAGDVNCKAGINMGDVALLLNNVSYPGDPKYSLRCC